jgi:predicted ester cyclase
MSADQVRETMESYVRALLERSDYGRFFADDIEVSIVGTDQKANGPEAAEQMIRFMHEVAFDAQPELVNVLVGEGGAAAEAVFVGTHTGEFAGVPGSGNAVRVPYSVFYDVGEGGISALRIYMSLDELVRQISAPAAVSAQV